MVRREVPVGALLALCASTLFQLACAARAGLYQPTAVIEILAAGALIIIALRAGGRVDARWFLGPIAIIVLHGALAPLRPPSLDWVPHALTWVPLATALITTTYLVPIRWPLATVRFVALCALAAWLAISIIAASPRPEVDVFDMQTQGADDLLAGRDPYATVHVTDTNDRTLTVPYTYPPVQLLITTAARATAGDVRFAMGLLLILAAIGARMALRDGDDLFRDSAALIVIGSPLTAYVLDQALVDVVPLGLACVAAWAWASEQRGLGAMMFGLTFAAKQPLVLGFPLLLLLPGFTRKHFAIAVGTAAAVTLPFFAWDPHAFFAGTVRYFIDLAPREDALTLTNLLARRFGHAPGQLLGVASALLICALLWRRLERGLAAMLALLTLVLMCMFVTGKIAFSNYYFLLSGLSALVAAQLAVIPVKRGPS